MYKLESAENFENILKNENIVVAQFTSKLCGPCYAIKDKIEKWQVNHTDVKCIYIPIENFSELAAQLGIFTVPTVTVFISGKKYIQESGYFSLEDVFNQIERYIDIMKN